MAASTAADLLRIARITATLLDALPRTDCTCPPERDLRSAGHDARCARLLRLRLETALDGLAVEPVEHPHNLGRMVGALEERAAEGKIVPVWRGTGMDASVEAWIAAEIRGRERLRERAFREGRLPVCARLNGEKRALRKVRTMLRRLAAGRQIHDMTRRTQEAST